MCRTEKAGDRQVVLASQSGVENRALVLAARDQHDLVAGEQSGQGQADPVEGRFGRQRIGRSSSIWGSVLGNSEAV